MNIGDYVRTDKGQVGKLKELNLDYTTGKRLVTYYTYREVKENWVMFDNQNITQRFVDGSCYYLTDEELKAVEQSIVKSSTNIIDLIEPQDLLYIDIDDSYEGGIIVPRIPETQAELNKMIELIKNNTWILKGIVTHEQLEEMEYKI